MEAKVIQTVSSSIPLLSSIREVLPSCVDLCGVVNTLDRKSLAGGVDSSIPPTESGDGEELESG